MSARRILQLGDPMLREISSQVIDHAAARPVLVDLRDTLHEFRRTHGFGRGISAIQIGIPQRIIYIEFESTPYCLINPDMVSASNSRFTLWDDCFSFPDLLVRLERAESVRVRYTDETGATRELDVRGAFSELLQHEIDHLDGILAIDRALDRNSFCTRAEWLRRYATEISAAAP